jgi:hypothetical protein
MEDRLTGLVVRVPGYRSRGPGLDSRHYQIFWEGVCQGRGPLSLLSKTEKFTSDMCSREVVCAQWGTNWISKYYLERNYRLCGLVGKVPGYKSRGPGLDSRHYQIFWEGVCLERGPLSLVSTIEELFGRNNRGFGVESPEYGRRNPLRWPRDNLHPQKLALTSPTSCGCSVGIVRLRTVVTEFSLYMHIFSIFRFSTEVSFLSDHTYSQILRKFGTRVAHVSFPRRTSDVSDETRYFSCGYKNLYPHKMIQGVSKNSFAIVFQMLLCDKCYENIYN